MPKFAVVNGKAAAGLAFKKGADIALYGDSIGTWHLFVPHGSELPDLSDFGTLRSENSGLPAGTVDRFDEYTWWPTSSCYTLELMLRVFGYELMPRTKPAKVSVEKVSI